MSKKKIVIFCFFIDLKFQHKIKKGERIIFYSWDFFFKRIVIVSYVTGRNATLPLDQILVY